VKPLTFLIFAVYLARPLCALKALASVWGVPVLKMLTALQFEASAAACPPVVYALRCDVAACLVWRGGCCSCFVPALPRRRRGMGSVDSWPLAKPLRMEHQGTTVTGDGTWKQALDPVAVPQQALRGALSTWLPLDGAAGLLSGVRGWFVRDLGEIRWPSRRLGLSLWTARATSGVDEATKATVKSSPAPETVLERPPGGRPR
jgi:hypothetical protein